MQCSNRLNIAVAVAGVSGGVLMSNFVPHWASIVIASVVFVLSVGWIAALAIADDSGIDIQIGSVSGLLGPCFRWLLRRRAIAYSHYLSSLKFTVPSKRVVIKTNTTGDVRSNTMIGDGLEYDPVIQIPITGLSDSLILYRAYGKWRFMEHFAAYLGSYYPNDPFDPAKHQRSTYVFDLSHLAEYYFANAYAGIKFVEPTYWIFRWVSALLRIRLDTSASFCDGAVAYAVRIALQRGAPPLFDHLFLSAFREGMHHVGSSGDSDKIETAEQVLAERGLA